MQPHKNQTVLTWTDAIAKKNALWRSESGKKPPDRVIVVDDAITADTAYRYACEGIAMLWRGDFQNARQTLNAMTRRADRNPKKQAATPQSPAERFHRYRMAASNRARILSMLLVELEPDHSIPLRRAPDARKAIAEAIGTDNHRGIIPLRELSGMIGAHEWRKKGIDIPFSGIRIHPHYGVFPPTRQEYIALVAQAPLPACSSALDIGTGTGVIAAILAKRGVNRIIATDNDPRAVACAKDNMARLGLSDRIEVVEADLFPPTRAPLVVFNPPWLPGKPVTPLERAVYDPGGRTLRRFLNRLPAHLSPGGEGWLLLSDLAEHLGLRTRAELLDEFNASGLFVAGKIDVQPDHPRSRDENDPLHAARKAETTSLWRLQTI